jgi:hypothetical protein
MQRGPAYIAKTLPQLITICLPLLVKEGSRGVAKSIDKLNT